MCDRSFFGRSTDDVDPSAPDKTTDSADDTQIQREAPLPQPDKTVEWLNAAAEADKKLASLRQ